jgi:YggT family protein
MVYLLKTLAVVVNVYSILCFIRIIITWIPGAAYSSFGHFLATVCDPFLNLFRGIRWMQLGNIDFTPMVAIGILTALSTILGNIATTGRIYFGGILALILGMIWSVLASLAGFLLILLIIRYIVLLTRPESGYYGSIWSHLDNSLSPLVFRMTGFFTNGRPVSYKNALLASIITLVVILIAGQILTNYLIILLQRLPF